MIVNGILVIDKPAGMTSHDVINKLRRKYGQKKFGHTGTLDPDASGVLVVLAGTACKILQFIPDTDKEYIAKLALGQDTDTDDASGQVIAEKPVDLDFDFQKILNELSGAQRQKVPAVCAKKIAGKKLMDYQRKGQDVPEVFQDVNIYEMEVLDKEQLTFRVACSSGTYVRSICRDAAHLTGNCGHMASLRRTKACGFDISQARAIEDEPVLHSIKEMLKLPEVNWQPESDIRNGKAIHLNHQADQVLMVDDLGEPLAVYGRKEEGQYVCLRGLW